MSDRLRAQVAAHEPHLLHCYALPEEADGQGREIDFDLIYQDLIRPAVLRAGMEPFRSDEELYGGTIHKSMFEHLMLADYAVVDLTVANPNVYYELGMRHGIRPFSAILMMAYGTMLPFNLGGQRALEYGLGPDGRLSTDTRSAMSRTLKHV